MLLCESVQVDRRSRHISFKHTVFYQLSAVTMGEASEPKQVGTTGAEQS